MKSDNNGKYFFGNVKDNLVENGWFFGHFMKNPLLHSSDVEVAWQDISNKNAEKSDLHTHKVAVEINILISGLVKLKINGENISANQPGDCWVVWPDAVVEKVEAGEHTTIICIKAPSISGDKYYL